MGGDLRLDLGLAVSIWRADHACIEADQIEIERLQVCDVRQNLQEIICIESDPGAKIEHSQRRRRIQEHHFETRLKQLKWALRLSCLSAGVVHDIYSSQRREMPAVVEECMLVGQLKLLGPLDPRLDGD